MGGMEVLRGALGIAAGGVIGFFVTYMGMPDFATHSLDSYPLQFIGFAALCVLIGAGIAVVTLAPYYRKTVKDINKEHADAVKKKDGAIENLSKSLASITRDYNDLVEANDGDPAHDALCEEVLGAFVKFKDEPHRIEAYVREQLAGGIVQNVSFGDAFNDLIKYECVSGCDLYTDESGRYRLYMDEFDHRLVKEKFPSFLNRKLKDNEVQPMTADDVNRIIEECERQESEKAMLRERGLAI